MPSAGQLLEYTLENSARLYGTPRNCQRRFIQRLGGATKSSVRLWTSTVSSFCGWWWAAARRSPSLPPDEGLEWSPRCKCG